MPITAGDRIGRWKSGLMSNPVDGRWEPAPAELMLPRGEVHIWRIVLEQPGWVVDRLRSILSPDELARADRYVIDRDRRHFAVGRGALRVLLSRYLAVAPGDLAFRAGPHGKPALAEPEPSLHFNLSHSHGLALLAVARDRELGIDIEYVRPMPDAESMIVRFFSSRERDDFGRLAQVERLTAFFRAWTRKEAYLKALGAGLSLALDHFDVTLGPDEPPRLRRVEGKPDEPARWSFHDLDPHPDYLAALAIEGHDWRLRGFEANVDREGE